MIKSQDGGRALFFASGPDDVCVATMRALALRFSEYVIDYAVTLPLLDELPAPQRAHAVFAAGTKRGRLQFLIDARSLYDMVIFLASGDKGYASMKLGALVVGLGRRTVCYNENGDAFDLCPASWRIMSLHLRTRWRMGHHKGWASALGLLLLRCIYFALTPIGWAWMSMVVGCLRIRSSLVRPRATASVERLVEQQSP